MERDYYMNKETGELLTLRQAVEQAEVEYDYGDPTNDVSLEEYYEYCGTYDFGE